MSWHLSHNGAEQGSGFPTLGQAINAGREASIDQYAANGTEVWTKTGDMTVELIFEDPHVPGEMVTYTAQWRSDRE